MNKKLLEIFLVFNLLVIGSLNTIFFIRAQESTSENVPSPNINEVHVFNTSDKNQINHEYWSLVMGYDDVKLNLIAFNATSKSGQIQSPMIAYQQNTQYQVGNLNYIASLAINSIVFLIGDQMITTNLTKCAGFTLTYSSIQYNNTMPYFMCNITFHQVQVYPNTSHNSTFDLTPEIAITYDKLMNSPVYQSPVFWIILILGILGVISITLLIRKKYRTKHPKSEIIF